MTNGTGAIATSYYAGGAYEVTVNGAAQTVRKYYSLAGSTFAMSDNGVMKYLLSDHLGSMVAVTDAGGTLLEQSRYMPFGEARGDVGGVTSTDRTYTGQKSIPDTGLMDYKARMYDPGLGRFIQPDTIVPGTGNTQIWNRYSYVRNSPLGLIDPSGHKDCEVDPSGMCIKESSPSKRKTTQVTPTAPPTSTTTTPTPSTQSQQQIYWRNMSEMDLAQYQVMQNGNNCAMNAIAASLNMIYGNNLVHGDDLGSTVDTNRYSWRYRLGRNSATLPFEQRYIIDNISSYGNLGLSVVSGSKDKKDMIDNLKDPQKIQIVTNTWNGTGPYYYYQGKGVAPKSSKLPTGHTVVLVAYDDTQVDMSGAIKTPWGVVNSWVNGGNNIFWMTDNDFSNTLMEDNVISIP